MQCMPLLLCLFRVMEDITNLAVENAKERKRKGGSNEDDMERGKLRLTVCLTSHSQAFVYQFQFH